jgi:hypothetical protein
MVTYEEERDQKGEGADAIWFFLTLFNLFFITHRYYLGSHDDAEEEERVWVDDECAAGYDSDATLPIEGEYA